MRSEIWWDVVSGKLQFWPMWEMILSQDHGASSNFVTNQHSKELFACLWSVIMCY